MSKVRIFLGPQGEPIEVHEKPSSALASGTDREQAVTPTCEDSICPTCGQAWGESVASQPGADLSAQPGATPDFEALREDDDIVDIDEPDDDEAFTDGDSPSEFELLA
jgi:hypothetical protein